MTHAGSRFNRQPAHVLILDQSKPFNHDVLVNLYQSLTEFFSLVTHISGPCRVPLFGLTTIGLYPEIIFPLQTVKGNYARLYSAMTEFKRSAIGTTVPSFQPGSFAEGFKEVVSQYQRQQQAFRQVTHSPCQLEISILSCQGTQISEQVCKLSENLDLESLKKVQILSVTTEDVPSEMNSQSTPSDSGSDHSGNYLLSSMVDIVSLENDVLSFMNIFKTWLKDCGTDCESVHIILPSKPNNSPELIDIDDANARSSNMVLKCDLHEAFIDPASLLCSEYFSLKGDFAFSKASSQSSKAANTSEISNKVHKLKAFCLVKTSGICESVVYGLPVFVRPTCCWKLDWEELESNQQDFNALCKVLHDKDISLVVKAESDEALQTLPDAFYLIMSSSNSTLLIKSVAVEELMLPSNYPSLTQKTSQESTEIIEDCLDLLPSQNVYNPFFMKSKLFKFFISRTLKNNPTSRGTKRRFQAPQKAQDVYNAPVTSTGGRGRGQGIGRQPGKKISFQSPARVGTGSTNSTTSGSRTTSNSRRAKTMPAVAVFETSSRFYDEE